MDDKKFCIIAENVSFFCFLYKYKLYMNSAHEEKLKAIPYII